VNVRHIAFALCLLLLFFVEVSYSTEQVVIEFFYWDPSTDPLMCWECPTWQAAYSEFRDRLSIINRIEELYGDEVLIEHIECMSPEGENRTSQYAPISCQSAVVNHEIKIEGDAFTEENLTHVIDEYLAGGEPDKNLFQPLTLVGAFSLGFIETFSPCLIAMLSFVLSYTIGKTALFKEGVLRVMTFGVGFVSAAVILGAAVALTLISMPTIRMALMWIVCVFAIVFGLNLLGLLNVPIQTKLSVKRLAGEYASTYMGLLLLGFVFYFLDPCIAPFAFTMLMMLQNSELILSLLVFCLGAIIPFFGIAMVAGYVSKLARSTYKHRSKIRAVSGLILVTYALYTVIFLLF